MSGSREPAAAHDGRQAACLLAVCVGQALPLVVSGAGTEAVVLSGIRKHPASTLAHPLPVALGPLGLAGDEQADLSVHGGLDKAVYAYPAEHYPWWDAHRRAAGVPGAERALAFGAMGENLVLRGCLEADLWVGDRLRVGAAVLRVEAPRQPCYKFNAVLGYRHAVRDMVQSGHSGIYLSVLEAAPLQAGDTVQVTPGPREVSIASINLRRRAPTAR
ncbi:MOSC domain-containing protein [Cupriavidus malaysiensis]|uniref:Sulfurase n=1 Tax=Cupriavidus malaysiensis TaxID=367825 RepID=A0ABM6EZP8_9BURK|nr:MOSC domain-containing protein [Cupriavidus malaysiensis]AOZ04584.1 sulfurase [Cupriavidus malaysiensis]